MAAKTKLAQCIARQEGFGRPNEIPTVRHNPGDLRHSPHSEHPGGPNDIGTIDSDDDGWDDLERQLRIYGSRGMTLESMIWQVYAPPNENDSETYVRNICTWMQMPGDMSVERALAVPAMDWPAILAL